MQWQQEALSPELPCKCTRAQQLSLRIPDGHSDLGQSMGRSSSDSALGAHAPWKCQGSLLGHLLAGLRWTNPGLLSVSALVVRHRLLVVKILPYMYGSQTH